MVYGSNPTKYSSIVEKGYLPEARAVRCPSEYQRTAESWSTLLAPWRKK
jgi:Putative metallopeptidase